VAVRADQIREGMTIYDVDGDKVGTADEVTASYVRVSSGFLGLGKSYYFPISALGQVRNDGLYLTAQKDRLGSMGFDQPPSGMGASDERFVDRDVTTTGATRVINEEADSLRVPSASMRTDTTTTRTSDVDVDVNRGGTHRRAEEGERLQLREEELVAQKRMVEAGEVEIRKDVVSEQRTVEVPVTREEVVIERHPVERRVVDGGINATNEVIEVPVREEEVSFEKRVVVTEEVEIGKRAVQETRTASDTIRKEVLDVNTEGDVNVTGTGTSTTRRSATDPDPRRS